MYEYIKKDLEIVEIAKEAIKNNNLNPIISPIRGGTDGASLTYMGLPCPHFGTGGYNCHGRYERIKTEARYKCTDILISIVKLLLEKKAE